MKKCRQPKLFWRSNILNYISIDKICFFAAHTMPRRRAKALLEHRVQRIIALCPAFTERQLVVDCPQGSSEIIMVPPVISVRLLQSVLGLWRFASSQEIELDSFRSINMCWARNSVWVICKTAQFIPPVCRPSFPLPITTLSLTYPRCNFFFLLTNSSAVS